MTRVLIATDDAGLEQRVREAYGDAFDGVLRRRGLAEVRNDPEDAVEHLLADEAADVLVLGADLPPRRALALARQVDRDRPDVSVLLVTERTPAVLEGALRAGVRDVVPPEVEPLQLRRALDHALEVTERRRSHLAGLPAPPTRDAARTIVVVSPKGGSGKTTVCANLAVTLAGAASGGTVLVDLDVQFGDIGSALRLLPEATWADVAKAREVDATSLKAYLTRHESGLYALCAPEMPADGELVKPEQVTRVLSLLAGEFRTVVVDTSAGLDEYTLAALEVATDVVLLCSMDVPSVRSLRKEITTLDQLGMTSQRRHLVLNRADSRVGLEPADVEATLGASVDVTIPSARGVPLALNQGIPLVTSEPRSGVARQIGVLAARFAPEAGPQPRGILRRKKDGR